MNRIIKFMNNTELEGFLMRIDDNLRAGTDGQHELINKFVDWTTNTLRAELK